MDDEAQAGDGPAVAFITNDLTEKTLEEAMSKKAKLIITYHPRPFGSMKKLGRGDITQRIVLRCARAGIVVYSPHTACDNAAGGVNDWLADSLLSLAPSSKTEVIEPSTKVEGTGFGNHTPMSSNQHTHTPPDLKLELLNPQNSSTQRSSAIEQQYAATPVWKEEEAPGEVVGSRVEMLRQMHKQLLGQLCMCAHDGLVYVHLKTPASSSPWHRGRDGSQVRVRTDGHPRQRRLSPGSRPG
eukprot:2389321-Rhodomonas_salina.1